MEKIEFWVFGYGSLLWRPDFPFCHSEAARISGWERRFWQGSPDHRGTPEYPGRVVTLVQTPAAQCTGRVYGVTHGDARQVLRYLDQRESGGYHRLWVTATTLNGTRCRALTYAALPGNAHYLGPAESADIAEHIRTAAGPSGTNSDYCRLLVRSLTELGVPDKEWQTLPNTPSTKGA